MYIRIMGVLGIIERVGLNTVAYLIMEGELMAKIADIFVKLIWAILDFREVEEVTKEVVITLPIREVSIFVAWEDWTV